MEKLMGEVEALLDRESDVPIYMQIQELLEEMLLDGSLKANNLVPSENEMADKLKVSRLTVRKSYAEMVKRNLFYTIQGKGTFVNEDYQAVRPPSEKMSRKKVVGVILPEVRGFFSDILSAIKRDCERLGFSILLMFNDEVKNEITAIRQMLVSDVVGILIVPSRNAGTIIEHYQKLVNADVPTVMIGKPPFKISGTSVFCDDVFASYRSVELLVEHENKKIGYVSSTLYTDEAAGERYAGYVSALKDYLPTSEPITFDLHDAGFSDDIAKAVDEEEAVTAFFCYCDAAAAAVHEEMLKIGKRVPEDVEIIGYDNVSDVGNFGMAKALSTVDQRRDLMGSQAVRLLMQKMEQGEINHTHTQLVIHPKLILRDTTRT